MIIRTRRPSNEFQIQSKKSRNDADLNDTYLNCCSDESGLILKKPPEKCVAKDQFVNIVKRLKQNIQKHFEYPRNVSEIIEDLKKDCKDINVFRHYLLPNIVLQPSAEDSESILLSESVMTIFLNVPVLQNKVTDIIFEKAIEFTVEDKCYKWIQTILRCFSTLHSIISIDSFITNLINLLDITSERIVKLEIITTIPTIIGDQECGRIATELTKFLCEDHELIPAILDCFTYLHLSDDQYSELQKKILNVLSTLRKYIYYPNFVNFLFMPNHTSGYLESVQGLRMALRWFSSETDSREIVTSQILTASAIRNSILGSKSIVNTWLKAISQCNIDRDHKPIDIIIMILLYTSEDHQRQVIVLMKKKIKMNVFTRELLDDAFENYSPIIKEYLTEVIELTSTLLDCNTELTIESFASYTFTLLFFKIEECRQSIIFDLLRFGLDGKQCISSILKVLRSIASKNMAMLKPHNRQLLSLLNKMDDMNLSDIREVTDLLCALAYRFDDSVIKNDILMVIKKKLDHFSPAVNVKGILAGINAVKYSMAIHLDDDSDICNEVSNISINFLPEGPPKESAQLIERISRTTKQSSDLTTVFYEQLADIIFNASYINRSFLAWLTDAVTNDLQENFIVHDVPDSISGVKLCVQYGLNSNSEINEMIALNIAGLVLDNKGDINIDIISPLFQLVSTLHAKQDDGDLSRIDALLGCPIVMPKYDIDLIENMEADIISNILDCLIHCANWFRELLNAFASQTSDDPNILKRILHIEDIENNISEILLKSKIVYKPPVCVFNISTYASKLKRKPKLQNTEQKSNKKTLNDDSLLPETAKTQTQNKNAKDKLEILHNITFRKFNLNILKLLNNDLTSDCNSETDLNIYMFKFLLKNINGILDTTLISRIKRKTFISKQDEDTYDPKRAEHCAQELSELLPKLMSHLELVTNYVNENLNVSENETGFMYSSETVIYFTALEYIYNILTIYFKWIGFKSQNKALLKTSLRTIAGRNDDPSKLISLKDLLLSVAKFFQGHQKYCLQLSMGVALIDLVSAIQELSDDIVVLKILKSMASTFLSQEWKTLDGHAEKGLLFNQAIDTYTRIHLMQSEIIQLKTLSLEIANEIKKWRDRNDVLESMKCVNKTNFPVLYRNLGMAVHQSTKINIDKGLTNTEHLDMWKDVVIILKNMTDMAKVLGTRNTLSALLNKSMPILKMFLSQGMPIIEMTFETETEEVLEILKLLQQSTRFVQYLCCHSKLNKDKALTAKVPQMRQLLETLVYKVKSALVANNCSEAFWMGTLKNKNIQGEVIASQQSAVSQEAPDDCDEDLPDDDDLCESDQVNEDSRSISDLI